LKDQANLNVQIRVRSEHEMNHLGAKLAHLIENGVKIYLSGDLGSGKTTFSRGFIKGLGHHGSVKSPTFTLVEPYLLPKYQVYHFDLYRLADPEELEYLGFRDYLRPESICIIEWPELAEGYLPTPDLTIEIVFDGLEREVIISAQSEKGTILIKRLSL